MKKPVLLDGGKNVEGTVKFPDDWMARNWVERADLLSDWINALSDKYDETRAEIGI